MKNHFLFILLICGATFCFGQNRTVGTIINTEESLEGYTFFSPFSGRNAYMIDNCGNLVNRWDQGTLPGLAAYFEPNGQMLRTYKPSPNGPFTSASNSGGLALVDWENNTTWSYELNTATELSHHDAIMMPNGNFLMLTWELIFENELIQNGRDPNQIAPQGFAWGERIIEVRPVGTNDIEIVWEWRIKDHLVQDRDDLLSNFGVVSEHPELFDINLPDLNSSNSHSNFDYNHFNAIDYNEEFDQILISVRNSDEIWIIDHSTTTAEAATHEGGRSGKGGDILYRWGNPSAYQGASVASQKLFGQHGVHWIEDGPQKNKILIFNNGNGRPGTDFSTVEILDPPILADGNYEREANQPFGPENTEWTYGDEISQRFYSPFLSNAQYLENGNVLINAGSLGTIFEINPEKELVWEYIIPLFGDFAATQGDNVNNNATFRAYKYPFDFSGFDDIEIEVGEPIELNPIPLAICDNLNSTSEPIEANNILVYKTGNELVIDNASAINYEVSCYDIAGSHIANFRVGEGQTRFQDSKLTVGVYVLNFKAPLVGSFSRLFVY